MKVLYIGSGKSSLLVTEMDLSQYDQIACLNNAHLLLNEFDIWIHPGDFPQNRWPQKKNYKTEISHKEYGKSAFSICKKLGVKTDSPLHYLGYTSFFNGLYWLADQVVDEIYLLGFDHDYNLAKVKIWDKAGRPGPQNQYNGIDMKRLFEGEQPDAFYGIDSTPDPMRLGKDYLIAKFELAKKNFEQLGIKLFNASNVNSEINTIPHLN